MYSLVLSMRSLYLELFLNLTLVTGESLPPRFAMYLYVAVVPVVVKRVPLSPGIPLRPQPPQ